MTTSCDCLRVILRNFAGVIRTNMLAPCGVSVDIPREERYKKCKRSFELLMEIRGTLQHRLNMPGAVGQTFRQLLQELDTLAAGL